MDCEVAFVFCHGGAAALVLIYLATVILANFTCEIIEGIGLHDIRGYFSRHSRFRPAFEPHVGGIWPGNADHRAVMALAQGKRPVVDGGLCQRLYLLCRILPKTSVDEEAFQLRCHGTHRRSRWPLIVPTGLRCHWAHLMGSKGKLLYAYWTLQEAWHRSQTACSNTTCPTR